MHLISDHSDKYVDLPPHVIHEPTGGCLNCNALDVDGFKSYAEYVAHWEQFEYEGERGHEPTPRDEWEYNEISCTGNDDGKYAKPATAHDEIVTRRTLLG